MYLGPHHMYLGPCQLIMMDLFCKNKQRLKAINYLAKSSITDVSTPFSEVYVSQCSEILQLKYSCYWVFEKI